MSSIDREGVDKEPNIGRALEIAKNYMAEDDPVKRVVLRDLKDIEWADVEVEGLSQGDPDDLRKARRDRDQLLLRRASNHKLPGYITRLEEIERLVSGLVDAMTQDWGASRRV